MDNNRLKEDRQLEHSDPMESGILTEQPLSQHPLQDSEYLVESEKEVDRGYPDHNPLLQPGETSTWEPTSGVGTE